MSTVAEQVLSSLHNGQRVFLPGSAAEVDGLAAALGGEGAPALDIISTMVPGINSTLLARAGGGAVSNVFASGPAGSQAAGMFQQLPLSYGAFLRHVRRSAFDVTVVQVGPPRSGKLASLGPAVEFTPTAAAQSGRIVAVVNHRMPFIPGAETVDLSRADRIIETDAPLREYNAGSTGGGSEAIAAQIAAYVVDSSALQIGLGKLPDALLRLVADRRGLRLHSGMLSDATRLLAEAGALDADFRHASCVHVGTRGYYDWLDGNDAFAVRGCDHTHDARILAGIEGLVAVNSALTVDLFGQANLETLNGRAITGVGGAADFARAAAMSETGTSIVALPAASADGSASRIVPQLSGIVSLPRQDIDIVITEFGAADLRGASVMERARRLILVADPRHRAELDLAWHGIARAI